MRFGLAIPQYGFSLPTGTIAFDDAARWAIRAEELGFDSVWISDHLFYSFSRYGGDPTPIAALEPLSTLAGIAARTDRVRLGALVLCAAFRHPAVVAKAATTIDAIAGGRMELGLGAGWLAEEFGAFGYRFGEVGDRFRGLEEALRIIGGLIDGEGPRTIAGATWSVEGAPLSPRPIQDRLPVWVGGKGGPRLLRLAARAATGWNVVWRLAPDRYAAQLDDVVAACESEGRDPATFRRTVGLYAIVGDSEAAATALFERARAEFPDDAMRDETWATWAADTLSGSPQQAIDRIGAFADLGVEEVIVSPWTLPFAVRAPEIVEVLAGRVLPAFR
ncbi:MAG TPA: LLM class flavin-dependent oxidoreductase [Actinomycetota bacterium]|nr:LLM class flavin-dependent oxidoreductase [Actinomycetota bacterium]